MNYLSRLGIIVLAYIAACVVAGLLFSIAWATQENAIDGGTVYRIFARMFAFGGLAAAASLLIYLRSAMPNTPRNAAMRSMRCTARSPDFCPA